MPDNNELANLLRSVIQEELKPINERLATLEQGQERLENKVDKLEIRMENKIIEKVRALFDAREAQSDVNQQILSTLQRMEAKIDVLQMETAHIRRVK